MANHIQNVELTSIGIKKVLNKYTPQRAISEYIWNGYDANATEVKIEINFETTYNSIISVDIEDNGDGIVYEELSVIFKRFYESQKSVAQSIDSRFSRGKNGYGRFTFFKLCKQAKWFTTYKKEGSLFSYEITMVSDNLSNYTSTDPQNCTELNTGTKVVFGDFSDSELSKEWVYSILIPYLKSEFAWYFKVYPNKKLIINNELLDCSSIIADSDFFDIPVELADIDSELFHCTYFQWSVKPQDEYSRFYFMDSNGNLKEQRTTLLNKKGDSFWHSVLVKSTFFNHFTDYSVNDGKDLFSSLPERKIMKALVEQLNDYLKNKRRPFLKSQANILVDKYENDRIFDFIGSTPWELNRKSYLQAFIRELYEVEPAIFLKLNESQKKIFIRLLDQVMDTDNNGSLFTILGEIIELEEEDRTRFASILESTRLKNVISTIQLIEDRLKTLNNLRSVNFDHTLKAGEVAHLQKLIEYHYWIFGEEYRFVCAEEVKFQEALERYHYALRGVSEKEYLKHPDKYKEMDLFITGKEHRDGKPSNLVIEIKNPTTVPSMKMEQYGQINTYMNLIMKEEAFNANDEYWTFMLIGLKIDDVIVNQMRNKQSGLCIDENHFRLYVKTWSQVLNEAEDRMNYLIEKLKLEREKLTTSGNLSQLMFDSLHNTAIANDVVKN